MSVFCGTDEKRGEDGILEGNWVLAEALLRFEKRGWSLDSAIMVGRF